MSNKALIIVGAVAAIFGFPVLSILAGGALVANKSTDILTYNKCTKCDGRGYYINIDLNINTDKKTETRIDCCI